MELIASEHALDGTVYNVATEEEIAIIDLVKTIAINGHQRCGYPFRRLPKV